LVRYHLFFRPMGRASGVGARCWGTPVELGCLLTYRQLISGCRAVRNLSPTGALFLFHDVRLYDPERRLVRGFPRKCLGMCRCVTNEGESGFGIANDRFTVAVEWKHHRCERLKRPRVLSIDQCYLHVKTVVLGGGTQRSCWCPSPFPSALIQRGDSCHPLPRVELIQKVSTKKLVSLYARRAQERWRKRVGGWGGGGGVL